MSDYRRLISYIYAYEGGVKGRNIGFAKLEARNGQCKIQVSVRRIYVGGQDVGVYLLTGDSEIMLGKIFLRGGSGEFRTAVMFDDVDGSGRGMDACYGLTIHSVDDAWRCYTTIWEDAVAHAAAVELEEATAANAEAREMERIPASVISEESLPAAGAARQESVAESIEREIAEQERAETEAAEREVVKPEAEKPEPEKQEAMKAESAERGTEKLTAARNEAVRLEPAEHGTAEQEPVKREAIEAEAGKQDSLKSEAAEQETANNEALKQEIAEQELAENLGREIRRQQEMEIKPAAQTGGQIPFPSADSAADANREDTGRLWTHFQRHYPKIQAFDYNGGCEILLIKPQDIGLLARETWSYGNNSFLLHGYYNHRYLILARLSSTDGTVRFLLGVPGHYYSNEKYMASMFGFPNFVLSKMQPAGDGRFGYWYTDIRLA